MTSHQPELHLSLESGILEAPAGVLLDGTTWHLFYQYRQDKGAPTRWGHTTSEETPFEWMECDDVLAPAGGELSLRAGSVTAEEGSINLYFTSVTSTDTAVHLARFSDFTDPCVLSEDKLALDPHVTRYGEVAGSITNYTRFRSPSVVPNWASDDRDEGHEGWLMLALTGHSDAPKPVILESPDGVSWTFKGPLTLDGDAGFNESEVPSTSPLPPVVSPRVVRLRDEIDGKIYDVLLVTLERDHRDVSGYLVGRLEGTTFSIVSGFQRIDFGHDFSRPRNTNFTTGTVAQGKRYDEAIIFGLLNGAGRADDPTQQLAFKEEGWANSLALPRHITLQGGKLYMTPPPGLQDAILATDRARSWTGIMNVPAGGSVALTLLDAHGKPAAVVTHAADKLTLDRSMSATFGESQPAVAPLVEDDTDALTVVVDGNTVEVFADGGQAAMASRVYFDGYCSGIEVATEGGAEVEQFYERKGSKF
ncbi:GH32 C-terminal domain-containing protein [Corynebacterium sp.]|uniref:GH32 C-terminal domain-containing protein n=1 Tax=Corynebacterium sp. TaxID=1720 RepID=UPI0026DC3D73|nr:GH32 C-terminal domain-containing protein [Corynebacterium sp.]MDO5032020.1 GH32 C-terminal domain-containing protein [Corynebacterium sp.]